MQRSVLTVRPVSRLVLAVVNTYTSPSAGLSVRLPVRLLRWDLSVRLPARLSVRLPACPSVRLSVCPVILPC